MAFFGPSEYDEVVELQLTEEILDKYGWFMFKGINILGRQVLNALNPFINRDYF